MNTPIVTVHRDRVKAEFTAEEKRLYEARCQASLELSNAEYELELVKARLRSARAAATIADKAFAACAAGPRFWKAVRQDVFEEDVAPVPAQTAA